MYISTRSLECLGVTNHTPYSLYRQKHIPPPTVSVQWMCRKANTRFTVHVNHLKKHTADKLGSDDSILIRILVLAYRSDTVRIYANWYEHLIACVTESLLKMTASWTYFMNNDAAQNNVDGELCSVKWSAWERCQRSTTLQTLHRRFLPNIYCSWRSSTIGHRRRGILTRWKRLNVLETKHALLNCSPTHSKENNVAS